MISLLALLALPASAQTAGRPLVPAAGLATESGPAMHWVNPANPAYDSDRRFALLGTVDGGTFSSVATSPPCHRPPPLLHQTQMVMAVRRDLLHRRDRVAALRR